MQPTCGTCAHARTPEPLIHHGARMSMADVSDFKNCGLLPPWVYVSPRFGCHLNPPEWRPKCDKSEPPA